MAEVASIQVKKSTRDLLKKYASRMSVTYDELILKLLQEKDVITPEEVAQYYQSLHDDEWISLGEVQKKLELRNL